MIPYALKYGRSVKYFLKSKSGRLCAKNNVPTSSPATTLLTLFRSLLLTMTISAPASVTILAAAIFVSIPRMFDIAFGTLTAGLGDYSVAPTVQLSTTFLKGIPTGAMVRTEVEAVSTGKTIMNFVGKAYVGEDLVGSASGTFMTPRPFKKFDTAK